MPHFIIDCSEEILTQRKPEEIMQTVYNIAEASGLFAINDIKVRIQPMHTTSWEKIKKNLSMFLPTSWKAGASIRKHVFPERSLKS